MNTVPFPQLQTFLVVARLRSFSGAARELGVSRSAVSQAIKQLEEVIGSPLLVRTTRSVSLTDTGRRLVDSAGPPVNQTIAALTDILARPGEVVGRLKLSIPQLATPFVVDTMLSGFRERHPRDRARERLPALAITGSSRRRQVRRCEKSRSPTAGSATDRAAPSLPIRALAPPARTRAGCRRERLRSAGSGWPAALSSSTSAEPLVLAHGRRNRNRRSGH